MEDFQSLLILMVIVWVMGKIFRMLKWPVLFGELIGGIMVGPLVLGIVDPGSVTIKVLAELGVFFLMLHSGLESDPDELLHASKKSILVAIGGVVLPFVSGFLVSQAFGQTMIESLFIAMCMSCTAIAISARLFKEYGVQKSKTAHITLGAAVIDDILALILFSVVLNLADTGQVALMPILMMLLKTAAFFVAVIWGGLKISKYMGRILHDKGFTFALIVALVLGLVAEHIGLHMVVGAFLAGLFIREEVLDEALFNKIEDRIYGLSYSFLGPIFFTSLAFHLDFTAITTRPWFLIAVILVAIFGKVVGAGGAALLQKIKMKQSLIIGLTMNSRGAVELIIASIGIQKGIIDQNVFSILVIMAFATTFFTIFATRPIAAQAE
jgi:Kef-type K+ transport system membrane component KefB